jgi:segregation and condensation protein A
LGQKGDWVVMAAWLVQLRSRLLLPVDAPAQQDAAAQAGQLRDRLVGLQATQALALWLERRPQLGRDVFARGRPEVFGVSVETAPALDMTEFLWASLALFDHEPAPDTTALYRPRPLDLHDVSKARARIRQLLAAAPEGGTLDRFLPDPPEQAGDALRRRSAWSSTLVASLELARQGEVHLAQDGVFAPIHLSGPPADPSA